MKRNGFTLIELICVMVLLAILVAIAVPRALKLKDKVNNKSYNTKIDLIEQAANNYGQTNLSFVRRGQSLKDTSRSYVCTMTYSGDEISEISYNYISSGYSETYALSNNQFWCTKILVEELVGTGNLDWDEEDNCVSCSDAELKSHDDIVINPVSRYVINKCQVYMYFKNNRVYSVFDKASCDVQSDTPVEGREYRPINY